MEDPLSINIQHLNGGGGGCGLLDVNHKNLLRIIRKLSYINHLVVQLYHSEMGIYDKSMRSISHVFANEIAKVAKDYVVINMNGPLTGFRRCCQLPTRPRPENLGSNHSRG